MFLLAVLDQDEGEDHGGLNIATCHSDKHIDFALAGLQSDIELGLKWLGLSAPGSSSGRTNAIPESRLFGMTNIPRSMILHPTFTCALFRFYTYL